MQKFKLGPQDTFPATRCKRCRMDYVLLAVFRDEKHAWLSQTQVSYCPYCGAKGGETEHKPSD